VELISGGDMSKTLHQALRQPQRVLVVGRGLVDTHDLILFVGHGIQSISEAVRRHDSIVAGLWSVTARTADAMSDAAARVLSSAVGHRCA
jgi:hypothetical protein